MKTSMISLRCLLAILMVILLVGCGTQTGTNNSGGVQNEDSAIELPEENPVSIQESYEYTTINRVYSPPAMLPIERPVEFLSLTTDDGFFYCETSDAEKADAFVNAQRTLLQFLRNSGVEMEKLNYFAMDTDDSFSESEKKRAHISLAHVNSYQQVLITLQTLWGDYTDYGYLYALANAIAEHLDWQTDDVEEAEHSTLDAFFTENPDALNLLYPCFTATYASEETILNCKTLSRRLLKTIDLFETLSKSPSEQVNDFRALVDIYAKDISVTFSRQENGYAYCGEYLPLKISTKYVLHMLDRDYDDVNRAAMEACGDDSLNYFGNYQSIFETMNTINDEISRSVAYFGLESEAGIVVMKWLCQTCAAESPGELASNCHYSPNDGTIHLTKIDAYLHEYFHHIDFLVDRDIQKTWQAQAFADLGKVQSQHSNHVFDRLFLSDEQLNCVFFDCYGRVYHGGADDYYDTMDILCYFGNSFELKYEERAGYSSFTHYLLDLYREDVVVQILLFPEIVETVTGKTWEELKADWERYMEKKFENFEIPDWIYEQ